ncbi:hypothetical protein MRX96_050227 [Rhipicephalus microplus]
MAVRVTGFEELVRMLGQPCRRNEQCLKIDKNSECDNDYCKCKDGYYLFNDVNGTSCLPDVELQTMRPFGMDPKTDPGMSEENMVPIIVCLAIMFVGMCVALQLFSRARFPQPAHHLQLSKPAAVAPQVEQQRQQTAPQSRQPARGLPESERLFPDVPFQDGERVNVAECLITEAGSEVGLEAEPEAGAEVPTYGALHFFSITESTTDPRTAHTL